MKRGQLAAVISIVAVVALVGALVLFGMPKAVGPGRAMDLAGGDYFGTSYTSETEGLTEDTPTYERVQPIPDQEAQERPLIGMPAPQEKSDKYLECRAWLRCTGKVTYVCTYPDGSEDSKILTSDFILKVQWEDCSCSEYTDPKAGCKATKAKAMAISDAEFKDALQWEIGIQDIQCDKVKITESFGKDACKLDEGSIQTAGDPCTRPC